MLPHISASEIFLQCTILILSILCVSAHSSISNPGWTCVVRIVQCSSKRHWQQSMDKINMVHQRSLSYLTIMCQFELNATQGFYFSKLFFMWGSIEFNSHVVVFKMGFYSLIIVPSTISKMPKLAQLGLYSS